LHERAAKPRSAQVPAPRHVGAWTGLRRSTPLPPARWPVSPFRSQSSRCAMPPSPAECGRLAHLGRRVPAARNPCAAPPL